MAKDYIPHTGQVVTRAEAKAAGLKRYFDASPCPRGHVSERYVATAACLDCGRENTRANNKIRKARDPERWAAIKKAWEDANRDKLNAQARDRLSKNPGKNKAYCARYYAENREQLQAAGRAYHHANRERQNAKSRDYHNVHRDRLNAQYRAYHAANREIENQKRKEWRLAHPEHTRETHRIWFQANKERHRERTRAWELANEWKHKAAKRAWNEANKELKRAHRHNRRARIKAAEGKHTGTEVVALFKAQRGKCAYCGKPIKDGYHIDHIMPLALGGSNWIKNIQLTCDTCNLRKNAKHPLDFARQMGRLL